MRYSEEEKAMWLEDWKRSGKSVNAYARENGLVPWTFNKWTKEEREPQSGFVEIPAPVMPAPHAPEIVIEKGGVKIRIPLAASGGTLRAVMEGLGVAV